MDIQVSINNTDISKYVVSDSYNIYTTDIHESWRDGNGLEHRVIIAEKVTGSFQIVLSNKNRDITFDDFMDLWNAATNQGAVTIGLYVVTKGLFDLFECYYELEPSRHQLTADGTFVDVINIKLNQR